MGTPRCEKTAARTRRSQRWVMTRASRRARILYQDSRLLRVRQYSSDSTPSLRSGGEWSRANSSSSGDRITVIFPEPCGLVTNRQVIGGDGVSSRRIAASVRLRLGEPATP